MRALCRVLAFIAISVGVLMFLAIVTGRGNHDNETAALLGTLLFGAGLISLTILTASEPRWPDDYRPRRLGNKKYTEDDDISL